MDGSTDERLKKLESRMERIEALLGAQSPPADALGALLNRKGAVVAEREAADRPSAERPANVPAQPPVIPPVPPLPIEPVEVGPAEPPALRVSPSPAQAASPAAIDSFGALPPPIVNYARVPRARVARPQGSLERTIGLQWAGWIGAAVLVVGAALGIKFAYDQGWLQGLPDVVKLLLMSVGGFALIATGEVVLRRVNRLSAAGFYGAGVAVLFLVGYAGHAWYNVYAQRTAFGLMGFATVIGVLLAARADLVSIAVLSLLGGHAAPILLGEQAHSLTPFLLYLLLLQLLALALCFWRASPKWWLLRSLALGAMTAWQLVITPVAGRPPDPTILPFAVLFGLLFQGELILTTIRVAAQESKGLLAAIPLPTDGQDPLPPVPRGTGLIFSMLVTAQFTVIALLNSAESSAGVRGAWVLGTAAVCVALALALFRRRDVLGRLALGFRIQAALLIVLSVPILLDGQNIVYGWLALAVGFAAISRTLKTLLASIAATSTWALALVALIGWSQTPASGVWLTLLKLPLTGALVVSFIAVLTGHAVALLLWQSEEGEIEGPSPMRLFGEITHLAAGIVWAIAAMEQLPPLPATGALLAYGGVLWLASFWPQAVRLAYLAAATILTAAVQWVAADLLVERMGGSGSSAPPPLLNAYLFTGFAISGAMLAIGWTRRSILLGKIDDARTGLFRSSLMTAAVCVLTIGLSVEIIKAVDAASAAGTLVYPPLLATGLSLSILCTAAAGILLSIDRLLIRTIDPTIARLMSLLLAIIGMKFLLFDIVGARTQHEAVPVAVLLNFQMVATAIVGGGLALAAYLSPNRQLRTFLQTLLLILLLAAGSLELDRYAVFQSVGPESTVRQVGWSIWWSILALTCILGGFVGGSTPPRVFGLGLFGLTLVKVALVDLSGAGTGWRILSFIGPGLLLLGTSVLYGRFSRSAPA